MRAGKWAGGKSGRQGTGGVGRRWGDVGGQVGECGCLLVVFVSGGWVGGLVDGLVGGVGVRVGGWVVNAWVCCLGGQAGVLFSG